MITIRLTTYSCAMSSLWKNNFARRVLPTYNCIYKMWPIFSGHLSKKIALIPDVSRSSTSPGISPITLTTDPPQHCWVVPHLYPVTFWTQNSVLVHLVSAQNQKTSAFAKDLSKRFREPFTVKHQSPAQWMMLFCSHGNTCENTPVWWVAWHSFFE